MGLETAVAIGLGGAAINAASNYFGQRSANKRADKVQNTASGYTNQPIAGFDELKAMIGAPNSGQDGFLQYLRANPGGLDPYMYDQSKAFAGLKAQDNLTINDQVNQLRSGAGSLGARFGTGFAAKEAGLRGRFAAATSARDAGISEHSFDTALQFGQAGYSTGQQGKLGLLQLLINGQLGQRGQELQGLGLGASQPQGNPLGAIGQGGLDISQLLLLSGYLNKGGSNRTPTTTSYYPTNATSTSGYPYQ